jgi:O-antigen/teichoic acid export membrane protein
MSYSVKHASLLNLASYLYLFVASLATTPTLIKYLGLPAFSSYALALGILAIATSFDLGLSRSVVYYLAKTEKSEEKKEILASSLLLHLFLGSTFGIIASILVSGYLGILTFLTFIIGHYQTYHESRGSFGLVNLRSLIIGTTNTLIATYLASLGYGVDSILTSLALATVLTILTFSLSMPRYSIFLTHKKPLKNLLVYGLKLQLGKVVNNLQAQYPKLVFAGSPLALTIYSLSSSLVAKAAGAVTQLAIAFFPYSISSSQSPKHKQYYTYTQLALFLLSLIVVSTYSYYGENILFWWLKDQAVVTELHSFLLTYRYYGLLLVLTPLASAVLDSRNMSGRSSLYGLAALLIELAVVGATLTSYGVMSVAYGSVAGLLIMVPVLLYTTQKNVSPAGN